MSFFPASLCSDALESRAQRAAGNIVGFALYIFSITELKVLGKRFILFYRGVLG